MDLELLRLQIAVQLGVDISQVTLRLQDDGDEVTVRRLLDLVGPGTRALQGDDAIVIVTVRVIAGDAASDAARVEQERIKAEFDACGANTSLCSEELLVSVLSIDAETAIELIGFPPPPPPLSIDETPMVIAISVAVISSVLLAILAIWTVAALRWQRRLHSSSLASSPTLTPPTCEWSLGTATGYACFLSHYKMQAGAEARYLHDLLQRMCGQAVFLDSNDLTDLRTLFNHVKASDVLVVLATEGVLERPWCLLEIYQAQKHGVPVKFVYLDSPKHAFDTATAKHFIRNLEVDLPKVNPGALEEINRHLKTICSTDTLRDFRDVLLDAVEPELATHSTPLKFHPWGSDNTVVADARDILCSMAVSSSRQLTWTDPLEPSYLRRHFPTLHIMHEYWRYGRGSISVRISRHLSTSLSQSGDDVLDMTIGSRSFTFASFIAYDKSAAAGEARMLKSELAARLSRKVYVDTDDAETLQKLLEVGVGHADSLLLLQTSDVLHQLDCLLQIYTAVRRRIPILPIFIEGGGYDYATSAALLKDLSQLPAASFSQLQQLIAEGVVPHDPATQRPPSIMDMQRVLSKTVPSLISRTFNPAGSDAHVDALMKDLIERLQRAKKASLDQLREKSSFSTRSFEAVTRTSPMHRARSTCDGAQYTSHLQPVQDDVPEGLQDDVQGDAPIDVQGMAHSKGENFDTLCGMDDGHDLAEKGGMVSVAPVSLPAARRSKVSRWHLVRSIFFGVRSARPAEELSCMYSCSELTHKW